MRFKFELEVTKNEIPLDYRRIFISYFKKALEKNEESSKNQYYNKQDPIKKPFTFSVFFQNPKFHRDYIKLEGNKIILNFSTFCYETGLNYYNSLNKMRNSEYPLKDNNYLVLKNILFMKEEKIIQDTLLIKTLSPILIRQHDRGKNYDKYLTPGDDDFIAGLRSSVLSSVDKFELEDLKKYVQEIELIDIGKSKEVKVLFYGHKVLGSIGKFVLKGNPKLLELIISSGIGSRSSSGFGMIEVEGVKN